MLNLSIKNFTKLLITVLFFLTFIDAAFLIIKFYHTINNENVINLYQLFDTNLEANIPTFFSVFLILVNAFILYLIGKNDEEKKSRLWFFWSALFLFGAIDELAQIHEFIDILIKNSLALHHLFSFGWVSLWALYAIIIILINLKLFVSLPKLIKFQIMIAGIILIAGALAFEIIGGYFADNKINYKICTSIEEYMEMFAMIVFANAFLKYLYHINSNLKVNLTG